MNITRFIKNVKLIICFVKNCFLSQKIKTIRQTKSKTGTKHYANKLHKMAEVDMYKKTIYKN